MPIREVPAKTKSTARGCPRCGSHDTAALTNSGGSWCNVCDLRWLPCTPNCRGYEVSIEGNFPEIKGCRGCGVPDKIARWWPEAYRAINRTLIEKLDKFKPVVEDYMSSGG